MNFLKKPTLRNKITIIFLFVFVLLLCVNGQTVNLIRFNKNVSYASGSGVSVIINPTGVFELNNQFILQLSDVGGTWNTITPLATLSEFYVPVINGTLPTGLTTGNYKLRVISTLPKDTVETESFNVVTGVSVGLPNFTSNLYNESNAEFTCLGNCSPSSNVFGQLNAGVGEQTSQIIEDDRYNNICKYNSVNTYKVLLLDVLNNQLRDIAIKPDGSFIIPNDLAIGTYVLEVEVTKSGVSSIYSNIFLFHGNSTGLNNLNAETVCIGNAVSWSIDNTTTTGIGRNYLGSKYQIDFGDGSPKEYYTHAQLLQTGQISHTFNSGSCNVGTPGSPNQGYYIIQIKLFNKGVYNSGNNPDYCNNYYENGNGADKRVNTSIAPVANFNLNSKQCVLSSIITTNSSILGQYGTTICLNTPRYIWAYKKPSASDFTILSTNSSWIINNDLIIPKSELESGCWEIRLRAQNAGAGCVTSTEMIKTVQIESAPIASFTYSPTLLCTGGIMTFTNTSNVVSQACESPTYEWTITPVVGTPATTNGFTFQSGYTTISKDLKIKFTQPGSYDVTLTVINSCGTNSFKKTIVNLGDPSVYFNPTSAMVCDDTPADYSIDFSTTYKPVYSISPYSPSSYEWSINGTGVTPGDYEYTGGTTLASAYPKITFKAYKTFIIKVKVNGNCYGSNEATFTLSLKEKPVITNTNFTQIICSGASTSEISLISSISGTTYVWETIQTDNITNTINKGSTNTIPAVVFNNNSISSGTVTYKVTPTANGCSGNSKDFIITVNPIPVIGSLAETICSGNPFNRTPDDGNGNIVPTGTTYSWPAPVFYPANSISGESAQTGKSIISQILTNTTNSAVTVTYTVTPKSGSSGSCDGLPFTVKVTVNSTPKVADKSVTICNFGNFSITPVNFAPDIVPNGTTYTWSTPVSNPVGSITGGSVQSSGHNSISQNIQNITNEQAILTYTVTPIANGCKGSTFKVTVTYNPTPKISNKTITICSGENFSLLPINANGDIVPSNTTYSWSISDFQSGITGESSGTDQTVISGNLTNSSATPQTVTYTITPVSGDPGNCAGQTFTLTITVNPKPVSLGLTNRVYCNGVIVPQLNLINNVSGTTYTWTNSNINIGLAPNSSGNITNIPPFTALNNTSNPITATIKLYPTFTNEGKSCNGTMEQFDITVNPSAVVLFSKGTQTKCSSETTEEVILTSATTNVSFNWTATKPSGITGTFFTSGTNTIPAQTLVNITDSPIDILYSATVTVSGEATCTGAISTYIIRINPNPKVTSTINYSTCSGTGFNIIPGSTGGNVIPLGTTYSWGIPTVTGAMTGSAAGSNTSIIIGTLTNPTNIVQTATYSVIPRANGCDGPAFDVVVTVYPKPVISNKLLTVCSGTNFTINMNNPSDIIPISTTYIWGIPTVTGLLTGGNSGINATEISGNLTNTTNSTQTATYVVTPVSGSVGSCPGNSFSIIVTVKPALNATIITNTNNACLNSSSPIITLTGANGTPPYTFTYKLNGGPESDLATIAGSSTATINVSTNSAISYSYSLVRIVDASVTLCEQTVTGNVVINIKELPNISTVQDQTICSGNSFNITPKNGGGNIVPTGTTYTWSAPLISPSLSAITGGSALNTDQNSISQTLINTTDQIATATYTVTPKSGSCNGTTFQVVVTVNPSPKVVFSDADNIQEICSGNASAVVNLSSITTGDVVFSWTSTLQAGITGALLSGNSTIPPQILSNSTNAPIDVTYRAKAILNSSTTCPGDEFEYKITVNPIVKVNAVNNIRLCNNEQSTFVTFGSNISDATYKWINNTTSIGLAASGNGNLPIFTATNSDIVPVIATITVTPVTNGCDGTKMNFTISVNPTPTVDKPTDLNICNGFKTSDINFTGNIATTTFNWVNDKPAIGLVDSGSGNIPAFTAINSGTAPVTANITVTPVIDGCNGTPKNFTITINPSPAVNFSIQNQTLCSGSITTAVNLSSPSAGAIFIWTAAQPANIDGVATSGTNTIPVQTLINKTNSPIQVKYTAYAEIPGFSCMGVPKDYIITVNPISKIRTTQNDTICSGATFSISPLDGGSNIVTAGTTYTWTTPVLSPNVGSITGGTSQNTAQSSISQTLINTTDYVATATYTVTPKSASCDGDTFQVMVAVNPSPKVVFSDADNKQEICSGITSDVVNLSSLTTGDIAFSWTANIPTGIIGATLSGNNTIPEQILENTTNTPLIVNYSASATLNNAVLCPGKSFDYKITVNPVAIVNPIDDIKLCNNDLNPIIDFVSNVSGTTYTWINDKPEINLAANGTGNLPSFTAINSTLIPIVATITVTPTANNCSGTSRSFTITTNPTPTADKPIDQTVCNGFNTSTVNFTGNIEITTYNWTNDNPGIGLNASGSGNILSFKTLNDGDIAVTARITVTPTIDNCLGTPKSFNIIVNPSPKIDGQPESSSICKDGFAIPLKVTYKNSTVVPRYKWFKNEFNDNSSWKEINGELNSTFNPPTTTLGTIYYYCEMTFPSGGCTSITSLTAKVTINPLPTISLQPLPTQSICVGGSIEALLVNYTGGVEDPLYQWFTNSISSNTGGTEINGATNSSYTPQVFTTEGNYYFYCKVTLTGNGCGFTVSNPAEVFVVSDPVVSEAPLLTQTLCQGALADSLKIKVSGGVGNFAYKWFSNSENNTISGILISDTSKEAYLPPTSKVGTTYYYCIVTQPNGPGCYVISPTCEVNVNLAPTFTSQPQSSTICKGEKTTMLSVTYKDGVENASYQWFSNSINSYSGSTDISNETKSSYNPPELNAGIFYYYCKITLSSGGCSSLFSEIAIITINQYPVISDFTRLIGSGTSFIVSPTSASSIDIVPVGTSYTWGIPIISPLNAVSGASAQSNPQFSISQTLTNNTKQVATVSYIVHPVSNGCAGTDFKITVTVNPPINPNSIVGDIDCYGANNGFITTKIVGGIPPYSISWNGPNNFTSNESSISGLTPGDYEFKITDNGGLPYSDIYTVHEPDELVLSTQKKNNISCFGAGDGQIAISVLGGSPPYIYTWIKNGLQFETIKNILNLQAGEYKVYVTDKNNCGPKTTTYIIKEPDEINITIRNQKNLKCYGDTIGALTINIEGGVPFEKTPGVFDYTYAWSGPNGFTSIEKDLINLAAGIYTLTVSDSTGCNQSFNATITQPAELRIVAITSPVTCYGENDASIKLDIQGGIPPYQIQWSNYGKGLLQENLSPGTYTITVTDFNNCSTFKDVIIKEAEFSIQPIIKNITCFGAQDGSIQLNIKGGIPPVILSWSDNPTAGSTRNRLKAGTYIATLSDGSSCSFTRSFIITEPTELKISARIANAFDCNNQNSGSIDLSITGGTQPYTISWSNGDTTTHLSAMPAGNYVVEVTDARGCAYNGKFEVIRPAPIQLSVKSVPDFDCQLKVLKIISTAQITGGVPPYQFTWSGGTSTGLNNEIMETSQSGIYTLGVVDGKGCISDYTFHIDVPNPGIDYQIINCDAHIFAFNTILPTGIAGDYSFGWNFGDGKSDTLQNPQHTFPKPGTYRVNLTLKSPTCTSVFESIITVESPPVLVLDKLPVFCTGDSLLLHVTGAESYRWNNGTTGDSLLIKQTGDYSVLGTSKAGCTDTLNFKATNFDSYNFTIQSDKNEVTTVDPTIRLWSESITYSEYFWDFGDAQNAVGNNQTHSYTNLKDGYYDVKLKVKNPNGCMEFATSRIWRTNTSTGNVFTPNGDGIDDVFLSGWHIQIYNRNGILIYEGIEGWDGTYKGKPASNDTYFYVLYISSAKEITKRTGFVTVIR